MTKPENSRLVEWIPASLRVRKRAMQAWYGGEPELHLLRDLCPQGCLALDIGANGGVYTWHLSHIAARVIAFEPQPRMAAFLRRSFGSNVRVEEVALSEDEGEASMRIPTGAGEDGRATIEAANSLGAAEVSLLQVATRRLDSYDLTGVGFVKIDVEGHELSVLKGATGLLQRERPTLLVEAEDRHRPDALATLGAFLGRYGYAASLVEDGQLVPVRTGRDVAAYNYVFRAA